MGYPDGGKNDAGGGPYAPGIPGIPAGGNPKGIMGGPPPGIIIPDGVNPMFGSVPCEAVMEPGRGVVPGGNNEAGTVLSKLLINSEGIGVVEGGVPDDDPETPPIPVPPFTAAAAATVESITDSANAATASCSCSLVTTTTPNNTSQSRLSRPIGNPCSTSYRKSGSRSSPCTNGIKYTSLTRG